MQNFRRSTTTDGWWQWSSGLAPPPLEVRRQFNKFVEIRNGGGEDNGIGPTVRRSRQAGTQARTKGRQAAGLRLRTERGRGGYTPTHTHTHTYTEREREREGEIVTHRVSE